MDIKTFSSDYVQGFQKLLDAIQCFHQDGKVEFFQAIETGVALFEKAASTKKKIIIVGNGGSAGIASHMSTDISKNGKIRSMCFSDPSLLTCLSNDYSYEEAFEQAVGIHADAGDLVLVISSSGNSPNILKALDKAVSMGCEVISFSGFDPGNKLFKKGTLRFHVPSYSYGFVEIAHLYIIHLILDAYLRCTKQIDVMNKNTPL